MKKAGFSIPLFLLLLLTLKPNVFAETVVKEGNSTSKIQVNTSADGGTVSTHIETTVNGEKQIVDSNEEGEIIVENKNGEVTVKKSPESMNVTLTSTNSSPIVPEASDTQGFDQEREDRIESKNIIEEIFENIKNLLKRIFNNL